MIQQEKARKCAERKEIIKHAWTNKKTILSKLMPSLTMMVYVGFYFTIICLLAWFIMPVTHLSCWLIFELFVSACLIYPFLYAISKKIRAIPSWFIGLCWLVWLAVYLPVNLLGKWRYLIDQIFTAYLSLTDCAVILWVLPFYLGIGWLVDCLFILRKIQYWTYCAKQLLKLTRPCFVKK